MCVFVCVYGGDADKQNVYALAVGGTGPGKCLLDVSGSFLMTTVELLCRVSFLSLVHFALHRGKYFIHEAISFSDSDTPDG